MKNYLIVLFVFLNIFLGKAFSFPIEEATIKSIHKAMGHHHLSCEQLINSYLTRIKKFNLSNTTQPSINAITEINTSVLEEARQLDKYYQTTGNFSGSLHCIPIIIKDNINTFDGTATSGSFSLLGNHPNQDAFLVAKLRQAGAIILGHTAMDEFAFGMYGISSRSGRIGNPYNTVLNPGGSSGGSAASVNANFALDSMGTDNSGSIRVPAAFNGLIGLRPSSGLISQDGIFPMGNLDGVPGPLSRTVEDIAFLLDVIAKPDPNDAKTLGVPRVKSYIQYLKATGLNGKRLGVIHWVGKTNTFENMSPEVKIVLGNALQNIQHAGATIVDINLPKFDNNRKMNMTGTEEDIQHYLASFPAVRKNITDICLSDRTRTFASNSSGCLNFWKSGSNKSNLQYKKALALFYKNKQYVEDIMRKNHLDALIIPLITRADDSYNAKYINPWQAPVASNAGLPSLAMPIGYSSNNLPIGIEIISKQFAEGMLIEIAYAYQIHFPVRKVPQMTSINRFLLKMNSISSLNNLFTLIGQRSYEGVLKNGEVGENAWKSLTPTKAQYIIRQQF